MYYEEKLINNVLFCRRTPMAFWGQCSIETMSLRIVRQDKLIKDLQRQLYDASVDGLGDK